MSHTLAVFDVDGTIVDSSLQPLFVGFARSRGVLPFRSFAHIIVCVSLYKVGLMGAQKAMSLSYRFLRGKSTVDVQKLSRAFFREIVEHHVFQDMRTRIQQHKERADCVIIISALPEFLIAPLASSLGIDTYFGTVLEIRDGTYTGVLAGPVLVGTHKHATLSQYQKEHSYEEVFAYADSADDITIMSSVDIPIAVNPDKALLQEATRKQWQIIRPVMA